VGQDFYIMEMLNEKETFGVGKEITSGEIKGKEDKREEKGRATLRVKMRRALPEEFHTLSWKGSKVGLEKGTYWGKPTVLNQKKKGRGGL